MFFAFPVVRPSKLGTISPNSKISGDFQIGKMADRTKQRDRHSPAPTLAGGRLGEGGGEEVEAQELADVLLDAGFGVALV